MGDRTFIIRHNDKDYFGQVATIRSTEFGVEDHGLLHAMLNCEWPGGGISVGGFSLDTKPKQPGEKRAPTAYGLDYLTKVMETVGVRNWERLPGQLVVVLFEGKNSWGSTAVGIAGISNDKVFILKDHADQWVDESDMESLDERRARRAAGMV